MSRTKYLTRSALGLALALGTVAGAGLTSAPALAKSDQKADASSAPKVSASKGFLAVAVPLNATVPGLPLALWAMDSEPLRAPVVGPIVFTACLALIIIGLRYTAEIIAPLFLVIGGLAGAGKQEQRAERVGGAR